MAVILKHKIMVTCQDGKLVRAWLRELVQRNGVEPVWEDRADLPIGDNGASIAFPLPYEAFKGEEADGRNAF